MKQQHSLLLELQQNAQNMFGFTLHSYEPLSLGWLNKKWRLSTDRGDFLLKIFHPHRFSNISVLSHALQQQQRLSSLGFPAPQLLMLNKQFIHQFHDEHYIIMRFYEGEIVRADQIDEAQMHELGIIAGRMHRLLNEVASSNDLAPQFSPPAVSERLQHWNNVLFEAITSDDMPPYIQHIELQIKITKRFHTDLFTNSIAGWAHQDLWTDNVLFINKSISAVLDFDRLNYNYPELDVARAIMSWAFFNGQLRTEFAHAFLAGYRKEHEYAQGKLVESLKMLWYLESVWWINAQMSTQNEVQQRFTQEMLWIAHNYDRLSNIVGQL